MTNKNYTFHPGRDFQLDLDEIKAMYSDGEGTNRCYLVALDDQQITFLLAMTSVFPQYHWVWGLPSPRQNWDAATWEKWQEIEDFTAETEFCLMAGCDVRLMHEEIARLRAAISGEAVEVTDPDTGDSVTVDYTETGLTPKIEKSLHIDRDLFPDLNIAQVLMKGLVRGTWDIPLPMEGTGLANDFQTLMTQLDGRFRQADITIPGLEKNITETMESLLRTTGIFDPEARPNITDTLLHVLSVGNDSFMWKVLANLANQILASMGSDIRIETNPDVAEDEPKTVAEILLLISRLMQQGNVATSELDLSTVINIINGQQCGCGGAGCDQCQNGQISIDGDGAPQIEGDLNQLPDGSEDDGGCCCD